MNIGQIVGLVIMSICTVIAMPLVCLLLRNTKWGAKINPILFQVIVGVIFGGFAVLATHSGIASAEGAIINSRDMFPLVAGLVFGPISGAIAGFIGAFERLMVGLYAGIGSYTVWACSIACLLAGLAGGLVYYIYNRKNKLSSSITTLAVACLIEVIHMVLIVLFKVDDASVAWNDVVKSIGAPMIIMVTVGSYLAVLISNFFQVKYLGKQEVK